MEQFDRFAEFQFDVLKEVGNIGAGNAATALASLLKTHVNMKVPQVQLVHFDDISDFVGGAEKVVIAIFLRIHGDAPGNMFFILTHESAKKLLNMLMGTVSEGEEFSEMELSALHEIGNILAGSYLSSLADFTKLNLSPSVPAIAIDMAGAVLSYGLMELSMVGEYALLIDTTFLDGNSEVEGHFFLLPDPDSFEKLFGALGVPFE
ncbi:chemotaxis protein CheC [Microaerobacter geothermalis]|uniref:chemotaxis protein CheC n=1 Tax=Microaerobacter geothermalis TaxID=674972 RepID=UPI001F47F505|nr:chemotaxis protein CheC [Microaerobacter geothermalis]MCF6093814.1 chemotaxis protein CheC [Microaerobacter geothermalis]